MYRFSFFVVSSMVIGASVAASPRLDIAGFSAEEAPSEMFRLDGLHRGAVAPTWLQLRPAQAFASDARLVVVGADGERELPMPELRHFIGSEQGDTDSQAFLSIAGDGSIRGWLQRGATIEAFSRAAGDRSGAPLELIRVEQQGRDVPQRDFQCGSDHLQSVPAVDDHPRTVDSNAHSAGAGDRFARVAIDTDTLYLQRFSGNVSNAIRYAADLIGYSSMTYRNEIGYGMTISYMRLWEGQPSPWQQTTSSCLLYEFGQHWNSSMTSVDRTIAHFLSGRGGIGGVAWLGVLCRSQFSSTITSANCTGGLTGTLPVGGDYGFTGSISGQFDPAAPQVVWDIMAVAHEIGHNFNSHHTHCYTNVPDEGLPAIDQCASGGGNNCYTGATSLPGPEGQGSGTIMSYCHQQSGGFSNITFTLGTGHPFGQMPERVPNRMALHAMAADSANPGCFMSDILFANGFQ